MVHSIACVILNTAKSILASGLESKIQASLLDRHTKCTSDRLCVLITKIIFRMWPDILKVMKSMSERYNCHLDIDFLLQNSRVNVTENSCFGNCQICTTRFGRSCVTTNDVHRGDVILQDFPFVASVKYLCGCRSEVFLVEHLEMAFALYHQKHYSTLHTPIPFSERFDSYFQLLQDGLTKSLGSSCSRIWPIHEQCLLISMSVIAVAYLSESRGILYSTQYLIAYGGAEVDTWSNAAWELTNILGRLPTNVHSISRIYSQVQPALSSSTVQQICVGYGLYLTASAINHSCRPNSVFRFDISCADIVIDDLLKARISLVASQSITASQQVFVSYGPTCGIHSLELRKEILSRQYLFLCTCAGCLDQYHEVSFARDAVKDAKSLYHLLNFIRSELLIANCELTEILNIIRHNKLCSADDKTSTGPLRQLESCRLLPMLEKLLLIRINQFSLSPRFTFLLSPVDIAGLKIRINGFSGMDRRLFADYCAVLCETLDLCAHAAAILSDFYQAAVLTHEAIFFLIACGRFNETDTAVARERVKLADLFMSCGRLDDAEKEATRGVGDLSGFVANDDVDYQRGLQILYFIKR